MKACRNGDHMFQSRNRQIPDIDLIYADPPFNTGRNFTKISNAPQTTPRVTIPIEAHRVRDRVP